MKSEGRLADCCAENYPAFRDAGRWASTPITDDEATRHLRGVLERAGEAGAQCQRKPYGPGWVAVSE